MNMQPNPGSASSTTGSYNIGFGYAVHYKQIENGNFNIALGYECQRNMKSGSYNTSLGRSGGYNITSGGNNICIGGWGAGTHITTGSYNICIGNWAGPANTAGSDSYALYIAGYSSGTSNAIIYGSDIANSTETSRLLYVNATLIPDAFTNPSDRRIKTEIEDVPDELALNQILALETRYYHYKDPKRRQSQKTIGFIAQEVKEILPSAVDILPNKFIPDILEFVDVEWEELNRDISNNTVHYKLKIINNIDISENTTVKIIFNRNDNDEKSYEIKSNNNEQRILFRYS